MHFSPHPLNFRRIKTSVTMAHSKLSFAFLIFLILSASSSGKLVVEPLNKLNDQPLVTALPKFELSICGFIAMVETIHDKMAGRLHFLHKEGVAMKSRKLLEADEELQLDYDYAGPNPKHDPRRGRGGGGRSL